MANPPTVRIFFSSPGDVKMERETARRIVERLQAEVGSRAVLEPYFWEHEVMQATRDYQQNIPKMDGFDVVVCILWSRLGSPLNPERHPRPGGGCFESGTEYEFFMAMEAHRSRGAPDVLVFRNRTEPRRPSRPKEAREAVDREIDRLDQFFEQYFKAGEYYTVAANNYRTLGEFEDKLTQGLHAFLEQQLPAPGPRARPVATYQGRPYLGLAAFDFADAPVFFGRTAQVGEVVEAFQAQELEARASEDEGRRFVLVFGSSGSGKSSLARAGVLPMLVQPGVIEGARVWRRAIVKPGAAGGDPFLALASALLAPEALPELGSGGTSAPAFARMLRSQPGAAGLLLLQALNQAEEQYLKERLRQLESDQREDDAAEMRQRLAQPTQPSVRMALLADQLEELFTTDLTAETRAAFVECLASIARNGRVFVLGTLRSDFYANCLAHPRLVELMRGSGTYALPAPGPSELGQMIRQPAAAAGLVFEENSATGEKLDELLRDAALRDPAALPLLGYTLEQLYERRTSEGLLTLEAYKALGGLEGAIGRRAEQAFAALPGEAQAAFDPVWRQLVTLGERGAAVRRRAEREALAASPGATALVDALVAARLFTADKAEDGKQVVSVVHEALLRHWPRVVKWIEENREYLRARSRLATRLKEWLEERRDEHYLIPAGPALGEAESLLARHGAALEPGEVDFIRRSAAHARTREELRQRRDRRITIGAVVLSVLAIVGGVFAWRERGAALREKHNAQTLAVKARASEARAAYLLGIEMLESGKTREGLMSLVQALTLDPANVGARDRLYSHHLYSQPKAINVRSTTGPEHSRQLISTGQDDGVQRVACLGASGAPEVVELPTQRVIDGRWSDDQNLKAAFLNRTGTHLVCRQRDHRCRVWSLDAGTASPWIQLGENCKHVACSDDGALLVEGDELGEVRLWDVQTQSVRDHWTHSRPIEWIELDSARGRLATAGGEVVFYDLAAGKEVQRLPGDPAYAHAIRFAEVGDVAVVEQTGLDDKDRLVFQYTFVDAGSGASLPGSRVVVSKETVLDFALSRDGNALALAPFADNAVVYFRDPEIQERRFPHATYPERVLFSPYDVQLLTACSDGTVRIFDAGTATLAFEPIHHDGRLSNLALSWDGAFLLTSTNTRARLWDLAVARAVTLPLFQPGRRSACGYDATGSTVWTASDTAGLQAWDVRSLEARLPAPEFRPLKGALFVDHCRRAVVLLGDHTLRIVDLGRGVAIGEAWQAPQGNVEWTISGDGARIAVIAGPVVTWLDTATGRPVGAPWTLGETPGQVCLGGDGRLGASILGSGRTLVLHDVVSAADTALKTDGMVCRGLRFSRDDHWLAAAATDKETAQEYVLLWDLHAPGATPRKLAHNDEVRDLRFSPDSRWLATGTKGQIAQVWNAQTATEASAPIFYPGNVVHAVLFSPDSRRLAVSYGDRKLRIYDWHETCPVSETLELREIPFDMEFSPDGTQLLTICGPDDGTQSLGAVLELAPPANLPFDLVALTESTTAQHVSESGMPGVFDPFEGRERVRKSTPDPWFFQSPTRRSVSPAFTAPGRSWMVSETTTFQDAFLAMPAVSTARAAMSYVKQRELNELRARIDAADPALPAAEEVASQVASLGRDIELLTGSAARGARGDALTSLWLGRQRGLAKDLGGARQYMEDALRLAPDDLEILEAASDLYREADDCESELRARRRLCELEPNAVRHRARLAFTRWHCGDRAAAQAEFSAIAGAPEIMGDDRAYMLVCLGKYAEALALWLELAEPLKGAEGKYPDMAVLTLAVANELAGDSDKAITLYLELIQRAPSAADSTIIPGAFPYLEMREAMRKVLEATLERHPELRPK